MVNKDKNVLLLGYSGYIGTALTQRLLLEEYNVIGVDNFSRRLNVEKCDSVSAINTPDEKEKVVLFKGLGNFESHVFDISKDYNSLEYLFKHNKIDHIINLAHNPSAPYSMKNQEQSDEVLRNNICGTNNILWCMKKYATNASKISAGSTGEFDHQIGIPIDENSISIEVDGLTSKNFMFPRHPNSLYHLSKISSTYMMNYISKIWNLSCTDVMQAVVFGSYTDDIDITGINTRIDSDESQGTVIHRFIVQACIGEPLTIYGEGLHQRGFLSLNDSIQAFMIGIKNPAKKGEYLTWNQLSSWSSINDISDMVVKAGNNMGLDVQKRHITSPRPEHTGTHYYNYITKKLADLGYRPTRTIEQEIEYTMKKVLSTIENDKTIIPILRKNVMPKIIF